jgi:RNA polymerase sigma factor (TIGR02999 family)
VQHDSLSLEAADVTALLQRWQAGDPAAIETLAPLLYRELRRLAGRRVGKGSDSLQPTGLVHEAWLRITRSADGFRNRAHFFATAALSMRSILVDRARRARAEKCGGGRRRVPLDDAQPAVDDGAERTLQGIALGEALDRLHAVAPLPCTVATMRFLCGCSVEETAQALGVSPAKVKKDWAFARAWLQRELRRGEPADG